MVQLLRNILFPFSLLYAVIVHIRNFLFDIGFFKSTVFSTPTVVIGNLSVGGTGKTPMTAYLIELLGSKYKIAILSRGYKRKSKGFVLAHKDSNVNDLGDEPFQIVKKYPHVTVAVEANRRNGILELEKQIVPDLIILDDAFQHRRVKPSLSLLLTSYGALFPLDWYLPTGNLRDAKNQSKRADLVVVTKCPEIPKEIEREKILYCLKPHSKQKVVFGTLQYGDFLIGDKGKLSFDELKGRQLVLVTGIANPKPLIDFLSEKSIDFRHLRFSDHHHFSDKEIKDFNQYDLVITTEKDFVRFEGRVPNVYYLEVKHFFSESDREVILGAITKTIKSPPRFFS